MTGRYPAPPLPRRIVSGRQCRRVAGGTGLPSKHTAVFKHIRSNARIAVAASLAITRAINPENEWKRSALVTRVFSVLAAIV